MFRKTDFVKLWNSPQEKWVSLRKWPDGTLVENLEVYRNEKHGVFLFRRHFSSIHETWSLPMKMIHKIREMVGHPRLFVDLTFKGRDPESKNLLRRTQFMRLVDGPNVKMKRFNEGRDEFMTVTKEAVMEAKRKKEGPPPAAAWGDR